MRIPLLLVAMALSALNVPSATADTVQQVQPALVGDWKAEAKDSWVLTFTNDGRWAQRDGDRVGSWGQYSWRDRDLIEVGIVENGSTGRTALWRVAFDGDTLTTWDASNTVIKWSRIRLRGPAQQREPAPSRTARLARVTINSVVIAPFDSGGMKWDGGPASADDWRWASDQMRKLAEKRVNTATTVAAISAFALRVAAGLTAPPDAKGTVQLFDDGTPQTAVRLEQKPNEYTPNWKVTWPRVALDHDIKIHLVLDDHDPEKRTKGEHIGTATITSADLLEAAATKTGSLAINVADQDNGRILAVNVFVVMQ